LLHQGLKHFLGQLVLLEKEAIIIICSDNLDNALCQSKKKKDTKKAQ